MSTVESWDRQIRLFAQYFLCHANLPSEPFTLLDVGCGTGAALGELKQRYPRSKLFGCDFKINHVEISKTMNSENAEFFQADIRNVSGSFDIIYASNILEHLTDWQPTVQRLLTYCRRLYIMIPYREVLMTEQTVVPYVNHVVSFSKSSFSFLKNEGTRIEMRVIRTPGAWGHSLRRELTLRISALLKHDPFEIQRELLVSITNTNRSNSIVPAKPFKNRLSSIGSFVSIMNQQARPLCK